MILKQVLRAIALFAIVLCSACQSASSDGEQTYTKGSTQIIVDESLAPIIEDQLYIFQNAYPNVAISALYKPENELLNYLLTDSIRIAVMARTLSPDEEKFYKQKQIKIRVNRFAIDGIALITQQSNPDSVLSVDDLIAVLQGKPGKVKNLVFDNPNSSTVRYLKDLAKVKTLPNSGIYALKSNPEVIKYVATHPQSIGVVGINWLAQADADLESLIEKIKVLAVSKSGEKNHYKPTQSELALGNYPLMRNLYLINCEGGPGPGTGFVTFVAGERGQRIVLKSGLLPDSIPPREVIIR